MKFPRLFGFAKNELFDFLELMDSENTPVVLSMSTGFFSEACGDTSVLDWEVGLFDPFAPVHGGDWLFRSSNQISITAVFSLGLFFSTLNFVKVLFEIAQLTSFLHDFLLHKIWWLNQIVSLFHQEIHSEVDQGVVEKNTITLQEISSVTSNFLSSFGIITADRFQNFVMVEASSLVGNFNVRDLSPCSDNLVIIFVVVDWNRVVDDVTNFIDFSIDLINKLTLFFFGLFLSFLVLCFEFQLFFAFVLFVGFLFVFDFVLDFIPFLFETIKVVSH